ncbi:hypothetical protein [Clostridium sp. OS1-26]|uniref:hypothetical protein n=1 Tax=Clostridium sp. OS1-26 TaxID=3070681 RepID=UPI0027E1B7FD|nr:hypothetical protein [Clostridium sp. OS1-26]WML36325.1 hypothetical protein RCG18_06480 [Clostridium sp. OS1-26]
MKNNIKLFTTSLVLGGCLLTSITVSASPINSPNESGVSQNKDIVSQTSANYATTERTPVILQQDTPYRRDPSSFAPTGYIPKGTLVFRTYVSYNGYYNVTFPNSSGNLEMGYVDHTFLGL